MAPPLLGDSRWDPASRGNALAGIGIDAYSALAPASDIRDLGTPDWVDIDLSHVDVSLIQDQSDELSNRWHSVLDSSSAEYRLRLLVDRDQPDVLQLAHQLRGADAVGSVTVHDPTLRFEPVWGWPLRVLGLPGSTGADVAAGLTDGSQATWIDDLVDFVDDPLPRAVVDFAFIADRADIDMIEQNDGVVRVNAVIVVGADREALFRSIRSRAQRLGIATIIIAPDEENTELSRWFERIVEEVSHNVALDVAVGKVSDGGMAITGDAGMVAPLESVRRRMRASYIEEATAHGRSVSIRLEEGGDTVPPVLAEDADEWMFDHESAGARRMRELRTANEFGVDLLDEASAVDSAVEAPLQRLLQASIHQDGREVEYAFRASATHQVQIWIGDGSGGTLTAQTNTGDPAFIDDEDLNEGTLAEIVTWTWDGEPQRRTVRIGRDHTSQTADFSVTVPAEASDFTLNVALILNGRIAQSGVIEGPITPSGRRPRRAGAGRMRFIVGPELANLTAVQPGERAEALTMIEHGPRVHELVPPADDSDAALEDRPIETTDLIKLGEHFDKSIGLLVDAQTSSKSPTWLASKKGARTFAELAQVGFGAYLRLVNPFANTDPVRLRAFTDSALVHLAVFDATESRIAVELLYDRESPDADAGWCDGFAQALETGKCPVCPPWDPAADTEGPVKVCIGGFWGVRKQIERVSHDFASGMAPATLQSRRHAPDETLGGLRNLRIGISDRVDSAQLDERKPTAIMLETVEKSVGHPVDLIRDWKTWKSEIGAGNPQLLVLLTHSEQLSLELGNADLIHSDRIKNTFVRTPFAPEPAGPIVLLLGCDTATTTELSSFVATFRARGASVVVGTIGRTLGRFAAPIAGELIALLTDAQGPASVGEALTLVRRRTMQKGWITGLLTTAFTDSSYVLER